MKSTRWKSRRERSTLLFAILFVSDMHLSVTILDSRSPDVALNMVSDTYFVPDRFAEFVK